MAKMKAHLFGMDGCVKDEQKRTTEIDRLIIKNWNVIEQVMQK